MIRVVVICTLNNNISLRILTQILLQIVVKYPRLNKIFNFTKINKTNWFNNNNKKKSKVIK